jgi:hypothetical protein
MQEWASFDFKGRISVVVLIGLLGWSLATGNKLHFRPLAATK